MTSNADKLLNRALALSDRDRAEFAARLIDSLDSEFDEDADMAWSEEIARRAQDVDQGKAQLIAWPEAREIILRTVNQWPAE